MTFGGVVKQVRCSNTPDWIAKENMPATDGRRGSMSLCDDCAQEMLRRFGPDLASLTRIER